ncbi:hypothetical protein KJ684_00470 [Patescibacteria group bacterium]|nr:hypothetical protein [Patescibacteria group bacterium]
MDLLKTVRKVIGGFLMVLASMFSTITLQVLGVIPYPFQEGGLKLHPLFGFSEWVYIVIPLGLLVMACLLFTADINLSRKKKNKPE